MKRNFHIWFKVWKVVKILGLWLFCVETANLGFSGVQRLVKEEQPDFSLTVVITQSLNIWR